MSLIQQFRDNNDPDKKNDAGYIQNLASQLPPVPQPQPEIVEQVTAPPPPVSQVVGEPEVPQPQQVPPNMVNSFADQLTVGSDNFLEQVVNNRGELSDAGTVDNSEFKPVDTGVAFPTQQQFKDEAQYQVDQLIEESNQGSQAAIEQAEAASVQFVPTSYSGGYDPENAYELINQSRASRNTLWGQSQSLQQNIEQSFNEYTAPEQERTSPYQFRPDSTQDFNHSNEPLAAGSVNRGQRTDQTIDIMNDNWGDAGTTGVGGIVYSLGLAPNIAKGLIADGVNFLNRQRSTNKIVDGFFRGLERSVDELERMGNVDLINPVRTNTDFTGSYALEAITKGRQYDFSGYREDPNNPFGLRRGSDPNHASGAPGGGGKKWYRDQNFGIGLALDTIFDPLSLVTGAVAPKLLARSSRVLRVTGRTLQVLDNPIGEALGIVNRSRPKVARTIASQGTPTVLQPSSPVSGTPTVLQPSGGVTIGGSPTVIQQPRSPVRGGVPTKLQAPPSVAVSGSAATPQLSGFGVQKPIPGVQAPKPSASMNATLVAEIQRRMGVIPKNSPEWRALKNQLNIINNGGTVSKIAPQQPIYSGTPTPRQAPVYTPRAIHEVEAELAQAEPGTLLHEVLTEELNALKLGLINPNVKPTFVPNGAQTLTPTQIQPPVLNSFSNLAPTKIQPPAVGFGNLAPTKIAPNPRKLKPEEIVTNLRNADTKIQQLTRFQEEIPEQIALVVRDNVNELVRRGNMGEVSPTVILGEFVDDVPKALDGRRVAGLLPEGAIVGEFVEDVPKVIDGGRTAGLLPEGAITGEFVEATPAVQRLLSGTTGEVIEAVPVIRALPPGKPLELPPAKAPTSIVDTRLAEARKARTALRELYQTPSIERLLSSVGMSTPVQKLLPEISYDRLAREVRNILSDGTVQRLTANTTDNTSAVLEQQMRPTIESLYSNAQAAASDVDLGSLIADIKVPDVVYDTSEAVNAALVREEFAADMAESIREARQVAYDLALKTENDGDLDKLDELIKRVNSFDVLSEGIEQTLKNTWAEINQIAEKTRAPQKVKVEYTKTKDLDPTYFKPVSRVTNPRIERRVAGWAAATPPPPKPVVPEVDQRWLQGEMTASELAQVISDVKPGTVVNTHTVTKTKRLLSDVIELMKILPDNLGVPLVDPNAKYGVRTWAEVKKRLISRGIEDPAYYRLLEREGAPIPIEAIKEGKVRIKTGKSTPTQPAPQAVVNLKLPEVAPEVKAVATVNDVPSEPIPAKVRKTKKALGIPQETADAPVRELVETIEAIDDLAVQVKVGEQSVQVQEQLLDNTLSKLDDTADIGRRQLDEPKPTVVVTDTSKVIERQQRAASKLAELRSLGSPSRYVDALDNFDEPLAYRIANGTLSDSLDFGTKSEGFTGLVNDYFVEGSEGWFNDVVFVAFSRGWATMSDAQKQWLVDNVPAKRIYNLARRAKIQISSLPKPTRMADDFDWSGVEFGENLARPIPQLPEITNKASVIERQLNAQLELKELKQSGVNNRLTTALANFDESLAQRIDSGELVDSVDFSNPRTGFTGLVNDYFVEGSSVSFNDSVLVAFKKAWNSLTPNQKQLLVDNVPAKRIQNIATNAGIDLSSVPTPRRLGSGFSWTAGNLEFGELLVKQTEVTTELSDVAVNNTKLELTRISNALDGITTTTKADLTERIATLTNHDVAEKFMGDIPDGKLSKARVNELRTRLAGIDPDEWLSGDWKPEPLKVTKKVAKSADKATEFVEAVINKRTEGSLSAGRKLAMFIKDERLADVIEDIVINNRVPELTERLTTAYLKYNAGDTLEKATKFAQSFIEKEQLGTGDAARKLSYFNVPDAMQRELDGIVLDRSVIDEPLKKAYRQFSEATELPKDILYHGTRVDNWKPNYDPLQGGSRSEFGQALYLTKNYDAAVDSASARVAANAPLVNGRTFNSPSVRGISITKAKLLDGSLPASSAVREASFRAVASVVGAVNENLVDDVVDTLDELFSRGASNADAWHLVERALVKNGIKSEDVLSDVTRTMNARLRSRGIQGISSRDTVALFDTSVAKELSNTKVDVPDTPEAVAAARHNVESRVSADNPRNATARVNHIESTAKLQAEVLETSKEALLDDVERLSNEVSKAADSIADVKAAVTEAKAKKRAAAQAKAAKANKKLNDKLGKPSTDPCQF